MTNSRIIAGALLLLTADAALGAEPERCTVPREPNSNAVDAGMGVLQNFDMTPRDGLQVELVTRIWQDMHAAQCHPRWRKIYHPDSKELRSEARTRR